MRKYELNENYFEQIDTEDKAYWLGFISADGCIVSCSKETRSLRLRINIHEKDEEYLLKFRDSIQGNMPIKKFKSNKGKRFESNQVKIDINSNKLCDDLINVGVGFRKTFDLTMPKVPQNLISHFIRGYFDGDGCICRYLIKGTDSYRFTFEIVGQSEDILLYFQNYFRENGISVNLYTRKSNNSKRLMICSKKELIKIYHLFYDNCNICMERKLNIFKQLL